MNRPPTKCGATGDGTMTEETKSEQECADGEQQDEKKPLRPGCKWLLAVVAVVLLIFFGYVLLWALEADYRYNVARDDVAREIGEQRTWNVLVTPTYLSDEEAYTLWLYEDDDYNQLFYRIRADIDSDDGDVFDDLIEYAKQHGERIHTWSAKSKTMKDITPDRPEFQEGTIVVIGRAVVAEFEYIPDNRSESSKRWFPRGMIDRLKVLVVRAPESEEEPTSPDD